LSYRQLTRRANRYARWARREGLGKGETVCLLMPNRPEYMAIWIGISRAGGVAALINTNLIGPSLAYCLDIVQPKHIVVAADLLSELSTAVPLLKGKPQIWCYGPGSDHPRLDTEIEMLPDEP